MRNTITLTLSREMVCGVRIALLHMAQDMRKEANNLESSDEHRELLERSVEMWDALRNEVIRQFKEQDQSQE